jgi:hypothetical protein
MKVFISYSHKDAALAREIAGFLEGVGITPWYDEQEILPGDNWAEKVAQGLKESDAMVVLLSPDALRSDRHVQWEIGYALGEWAYNKRLITVMVGEPEQFPKEGFPWILRRLKVIPLRQESHREESLRQLAQALKEVA